MNTQEIDQDQWGPSGWSFIHYIALKYPKDPTNEDKEKYFTFFNTLQYVLPCEKCAANYGKNLEELPIRESLSNNADLFKWTVDIHNLVNTELNKPTLTYEEALNIYLNKTNKTYNVYILLSFGLLVILLIYYCYKNKIFSRFK